MFHGYACYAGTEIVNSARAAAYAALNGMPVTCHGCDGLPQALEGDEFPGYTNPRVDDAAWYDPAVAASTGFWGALGLEVIGGSTSTATTSWTALLGDGAMPGPLRRSAREVQLRVLLVAQDDACLSYGLSWLASALRGSQCAQAGGDRLEMFAACPDTTATAPTGSCDTGQATSPVHWPTSGWGRGDTLLRTLYWAALLEGPEVAAWQTWPGGVSAEVNFTLKAGSPYWYHLPVEVASPAITPNRLPYYWTTWVELFNSDGVWNQCLSTAEQEQDLLTDPLNPDCAPVEPPAPPVAPVDPCYPGGDYAPYGAYQTLVQIPPALPEWLEKVPVVHIDPGSSPLRRFLLRWWLNPLQDAANAWLDPCLACTQMTVAYLPEQTRFVVDGRTQEAVIEAAGGRYARPVLYGPNGGTYSWPTLDCSSALILQLTFDARYPPASDMSFSVSLAAREDAA